MRRIILASGSEGRKELFEQYYKDQFDIIVPGTEEEDLHYLPPKEMVSQLSLRKANSLADKYYGHIICAFDTMVECNGQVLGKPASISEARDMLHFLSATPQTVWSGYTIIYKEHLLSGVESAELQLTMSTEDIETYIQTHNVIKFAGAYAIQKEDSNITILSGTKDTIIGAPMETVCRFIDTHR